MSEIDWRTVVAELGLEPHPEGGFYRETFRDAEVGSGLRAHSTAIYFLLPAGVVSRWHRVDAAEVWHWYAGAPLQLSWAEGARKDGSGDRAAGPDLGRIDEMSLGNALSAGARPQHVIRAGIWQQARSRGTWTLAGCTVAPGFEFSGFEMAADA